jgi:hypothetical protein
MADVDRLLDVDQLPMFAQPVQKLAEILVH